jgi:hypothetical protein
MFTPEFGNAIDNITIRDIVRLEKILPRPMRRKALVPHSDKPGEPAMPRIPEPELQRLREEVSVQRLVEAGGVGLKKAGKDWLGRCPWHDDREASLVVSPAKNLWHRFGCQIGGGPIDCPSQGSSHRLSAGQL